MKQAEVEAIKEAMEKGINDGMQTFDQAIFCLYKEGRISLDEAIANADSVTDRKLKIKMDAVGSNSNGSNGDGDSEDGESSETSDDTGGLELD